MMKLLTYKKRLYVVKQTLRAGEDGPAYEVRYAEDVDTKIPFLYTKEQLDAGQLDHGMEQYVEVEVTIRPLKAVSLGPALPMCKMKMGKNKKG